MIKITGYTEDNRPVVGGVFEFYDTHGLPLPDILTFLQEKNFIPDWNDFVYSAKKAGWKAKTIQSRVREAIIDTTNPKYWDEMKDKLQICVENHFQ